MPLPSGGTWPPPALAPVHTKQAEWAAWYSGDPEALSAIYGGAQTGNDTSGFFASERGGIRNRVSRTIARWFWGTIPTPAQPRTKLHIPLASDIAMTGANLLFSEPVAITTDGGNNKRLEELIEDGGLHSTLLEAAELCAALGGVYLRVCWDETVSDYPWLSPVHADAAVPEFTWGRLTAVTFWRIVSDDGRKVLRHLERHEKGVILHGLYEGTSDDLGHVVPLTESPDTAALADEVNENGAIPTEIDLLTAAYIPNMKPNRIWRGTPAAAHLGRSAFQGIEPLMDGLDEVYSSWKRDIRIGVGRIMVPNNYLDAQGKGKGSTFDVDREVFQSFNVMEDGQSGLLIHAQQFSIRVDEHQRTAQDFVNQAVRAAGYSAQTFGEQGDTAMTATEAQTRERRSFTTRGRQIGYWRMGLGSALHALVAIDAVKFRSGIKVERPKLEWPDGVANDPKALAETLNQLQQAVAASTYVKVKMLHPDWEDTEVLEEVDKIKEENNLGELVTDPLAVRPADPAVDSGQGGPDASTAGEPSAEADQPFPNRE